MENFDAQELLDLYIHDYLLKKNLRTTADTLALEANIQPKSVGANPPEGFLSEWWSFFWEVYCSRTGINPSGQRVSTFMPPQPPQTSAPVPQNAQPVSLMTNANYMLQNICPTMTGPMMEPRPEMRNLLSMVPPRIVDPTLNARDVEQFSRMQPSGSNSGSRKKKASKKRQSPLSQSFNAGTGLRGPTIPELASLAPRLIPDRAERADAAGSSSASSNSSCPDANF